MSPAIDIASIASKPAEVETDGLKIKSHSLADLIAANQEAAAETAVDGTNENGGPLSAWGCLRPARALPMWTERRAGV